MDKVYGIFSVVGKGKERNEKLLIACIDKDNAKGEQKRIRAANKNKFPTNKFILKVIPLSDC